MPAISQIPVSYPFQSYFDSTLHERAILSQPKNSLLVPSTKKTEQGAGYAVGVSATSDVPVAFRFYGGKADSGVVICRPGQFIRPGQFSAFDYGLPFGWLGGGDAMIIVARTPDADLYLGSPATEIIFHRTRLLIQASASPLPALIQNWPRSFPWGHALSGVGPADQRGAPTIRVQPTRTLLRLRSAIAVPTTVGLVFRGSREFDENSAGTALVTDTDSTFTEVSFNASTDPLLRPYPTTTIQDPMNFLDCQDGGISALSLGVAGLVGVEIDVVRFGRI